MKSKKSLFAICFVLMAVILIPSLAGAGPMGGKEKAVNINEASAEELSQLKGMDMSKASAIVQYRDSHGPFTSPEEVKNVGGIDDQTFSLIKDKINVGHEKQGMHK